MQKIFSIQGFNPEKEFSDYRPAGYNQWEGLFEERDFHLESYRLVFERVGKEKIKLTVGDTSIIADRNTLRNNLIQVINELLEPMYKN